MIGLMIRILFLLLCAVLIAATWWLHISSTFFTFGHDTFYTQVHPWLREIRLGSLFGLLAFCVVIARRDPTFTRIGLFVVIASLAVMQIPPQEVRHTVTKIDNIKLDLRH